MSPRGKCVLCVGETHFSPGPGARKCSDILLTPVLSPLCSLCPMCRVWTGVRAGQRRYRALVTLCPGSQYHTTNNTPLHHKILDGKRENSPSPKYRTDTGQALTTRRITLDSASPVDDERQSTIKMFRNINTLSLLYNLLNIKIYLRLFSKPSLCRKVKIWGRKKPLFTWLVPLCLLPDRGPAPGWSCP